MSEKGIMLDTSFFVRLLDKTDPLHANALGYFKYSLENDFEIYISLDIKSTLISRTCFKVREGYIGHLGY